LGEYGAVGAGAKIPSGPGGKYAALAGSYAAGHPLLGGKVGRAAPFEGQGIQCRQHWSGAAGVNSGCGRDRRRLGGVLEKGIHNGALKTLGAIIGGDECLIEAELQIREPGEYRLSIRFGMPGRSVGFLILFFPAFRRQGKGRDLAGRPEAEKELAGP